MRLNIDVNKAAVPMIRKQIADSLASLSQSQDKLTKFMMVAARGLNARIRMTEDETYRMVSEYFKEKDI